MNMRKLFIKNEFASVIFFIILIAYQMNTCKYIFKRGANKDKNCTRKSVQNENFCTQHIKYTCGICLKSDQSSSKFFKCCVNKKCSETNFVCKTCLVCFEKLECAFCRAQLKAKAIEYYNNFHAMKQYQEDKYIRDVEEYMANLIERFSL